MAALVTSMMLFLVCATFQHATALSVGSFHESSFFDPSKHWMGEATLRELFDDETIDQLQENGFVKTRQNPDYPDRTQYFVVKTPADADLIYAECFQKADGKGATGNNHEEADAQNLGKEWINTEKVREEYGDDRVEKLVKSGYLEKRQHPDFPEQTQLGKRWISTQSLLETYGFDKVEELLKSGHVEKRQNPRCPERTQYFVEDDSASSAQTAEEKEQEPEETNVKRHAEAKLQKHGMAKNRDALHKHDSKDAKDEEATAQKQGAQKLQKHGKKHNHKGKVHQHADKEIDVQKLGDDVAQKNANQEDADGVVDSDDKQKSAAIPTRFLTTVVAIAASVFFV